MVACADISLLLDLYHFISDIIASHCGSCPAKYTLAFSTCCYLRVVEVINGGLKNCAPFDLLKRYIIFDLSAILFLNYWLNPSLAFLQVNK